jgi:hypothetical protein
MEPIECGGAEVRGRTWTIAALVAAVRQVAQGTRSAGSWTLEHPVVTIVAYCALIIAACLPLGVRKFSPGP